MTLKPEILLSMKRIEIVVSEESLRELFVLCFEKPTFVATQSSKGPEGLGPAGNATRMTTFSRMKTR